MFHVEHFKIRQKYKMFHVEHSEKQAQKSTNSKNVPRGTFAKNRKKQRMFHVEHFQNRI